MLFQSSCKHTALLPNGESPNTSEISLPDDGITADTAVPNSEPLMLNVEEDT